jgi:hypothetical protein
VTAVLASAAACDRLAVPAGARILRTAPREALVLGEVETAGLHGALGDPGALVEDVTDGWTGFVLTGDDAQDVFARLSELPAPRDWLQGEVAKAAAKVVSDPGQLTILVPAHLSAHVEERIRTDARELLR